MFSSATLNGRAPWALSTGWTIKAYDLAQAKPRVPVYTWTGNTNCIAASNSQIPPEVAVCLSYKADPIPGNNPASMRGRMYIGGIGTGVAVGTGSAFPAPNGSLIAGMAAAATGWANGITGAPAWNWVVYSRKLGVHWNVTNGWIDNAFDIQRRRGNAATARTTWT